MNKDIEARLILLASSTIVGADIKVALDEITRLTARVAELEEFVTWLASFECSCGKCLYCKAKELMERTRP